MYLRKPTINWKGHFYVSNMSPTGGQGFTKCGCKGTCDSNTCKCKKSNILCNAAATRVAQLVRTVKLLPTTTTTITYITKKLKVYTFT